MSDPGPAAPSSGAGRSRHAGRTVALLLVGAVLGGVLGWASPEPLYRCEGRCAVLPHRDAAMPADVTCPWGKGRGPLAAAYQMELLASRRTTLLATEDDVWQGTDEAAGRAGAARFEARRSVEHVPGASRLLVRFDHPRPEVALAGVRALLAAYERLAAELREADDTDELLAAARLVVEDRGTLPTAPLRDRRASLASLGAVLGAGLGLLLVFRPRPRA